MKNFRLLFLSALAGLLAVSCTDEDLNETWHPDQGLVTVITDWGESKDAYWTMPYTIKYGMDADNMVEHTAHGLVERLPLQEPGLYNIEILNSGEGFTVNGDEVTIDDDGEPGFIKSNPAYLYTARTSVTAVKDRNTTIKVPMTIQMKKLVVRVYFKNDPTIYTSDNPSGFKRPVKAVRAHLSGVAKKMNFIEGTYDDTGYSVNLPFNVRNTIAEGRFLECSLVLLGVTGTEQKMHLEVDFDYGENLRPEDYDFNEKLVELAFNDDKSEADTVNSEINMVLTAGGEATIKPYEPGGSKDIEVGEGEIEYAIGDLYPKHDQSRPTGVVVWLTPDSKHGIVLAGQGSDELPEGSADESLRGMVSWGTLAEIDDATNTMGIRNTAGISSFIAKESLPQISFGAFNWLVEAYNNDPQWFLPSKAEWSLIGAISDPDLTTINDNLTNNGFLPLDLTATYWSSETKKGAMTDPTTWSSPDVPEYYPSCVYTWSKDNGIQTAYVNKELNDNPPPATPEGDPSWADPSGENPTPVLYKARAMRFF